MQIKSLCSQKKQEKFIKDKKQMAIKKSDSMLEQIDILMRENEKRLNSEFYEEVLKEAQLLGYAEANPTNDVEGYDSAYKLSILSSLSFHTKVPYTEIYREGITKINIADIKYAKQFGYALKLLALGKDGENGIEVRVHPALIKSTHPLAGVNDSYNAVYIAGDSVENVMLYGRGAGALPTGSAIVGDIIYCATHPNHSYSTFKNTENADP